MTAPKQEQDRRWARAVRRLPSAALWIGGSCILVELILQAADFGLIGSTFWRSLAYQNGAFWPGLLQGWTPNYFAQPVLMFVTYAFLHGGFGHLVGNMIALMVLARVAAEHVSPRAFLLIYLVSVFGGAAVFGLLIAGPQPMIGASGALFGLAGAWQYWDYINPRRARGRVVRLIRGAGLLIGLNALLWYLLDGIIAWQTHLGGFLAGWIVAAALPKACRVSTEAR